jgi:hypothetical protein
MGRFRRGDGRFGVREVGAEVWDGGSGFRVVVLGLSGRYVIW